jgi:hypothetical protein
MELGDLKGKLLNFPFNLRVPTEKWSDIFSRFCSTPVDFHILPYQLELFGGFLSHQWYPQFSSIFWIMGNQGSSGDPPGPHAVGLQPRALRSTGLPLPVAI